ncbi:hypothetical protein Bca101_071531 [Brassica carinata]
MDLGADDKMKVWIFIPQSIPKHNWLTRGLEATPSPYGIKPGRHYWDGVDCKRERVGAFVSESDSISHEEDDDIFRLRHRRQNEPCPATEVDSTLKAELLAIILNQIRS